MTFPTSAALPFLLLVASVTAVGSGGSHSINSVVVSDSRSNETDAAGTGLQPAWSRQTLDCGDVTPDRGSTVVWIGPNNNVVGSKTIGEAERSVGT